MQEKKIAECVKILINIGNYQNIEIAKYEENVIKFETEEEMVRKEDEISDRLLSNLVRTIDKIPKNIKRSDLNEIVSSVKDAVEKKIPEWLASGPVPNIAYKMKKTADVKNDNLIEDTLVIEDDKKQANTSTREKSTVITKELNIPAPIDESVKREDPEAINSFFEGVDSQGGNIGEDILSNDDDLFN